ncbi:tetratricopeptide repeat protein [Enhygromyxa salina]|uniref:Cellulose synthase subunit BcsC n=1 Tax=Enhygromyxa salina TaxID=215803 RepID=A0A2S9YS75_9BACT|nr:tetratricopeptide repeat protein [Enhygromyxa salina]PRQ07938.1 cellulose synthase subunit BcsC [Enhygromyxa salina]
MKRAFGLALAAILILPACKPKEVDPNLPEQIAAKLAESDSNLRNNKTDEAAEGYQWVLDNEPANVAALTGLGRVELDRGNFAAAVDPLEKAVAQNGDDAEARAALGRAYSGAENWPKAAEHLGKAWELDHDTEQFGLEYGVALRESGELEQAKAVLTEVGEINPKIKHVFRELGETQLAAKEYDTALRTFMKAQTNWPGDQDSYAGAAMVYEAQGEITKSVDQWSQYIQQDCCSTYSKDVAQPKLAELKAKENAAGVEPPTEG